jgi:hypothetical protein
MVYVIQVCRQLSSRIRMERQLSSKLDQDISSWSCCYCSKAVYKPVWYIPLLSVQWITPDDGQRNWPKHVEFHFQNKVEKFVHLVGFIIRRYLSRCTVTWKSNSVQLKDFFKYKMKFDNYLTSITQFLILFNNVTRINRNCVVSM